MPTFLHAVTLGTIVLVAAFTLLAAGESLPARSFLNPSQKLTRIPVHLPAAGLLWLADTLEHNPKGARTWGRFLVYVSRSS
jgi:hypothetical protein